MNKVPYRGVSNAETSAATHDVETTLRHWGVDPAAIAGAAVDAVYDVLRHFRPDLFADDPTRGMLLLQICCNDDVFYYVSRDVLKRSLQVPRKERLRWLYGKDEGGTERLLRAEIHSDSEVDFILVVDGYGDDESWDEYEESVLVLIDEHEDDRETIAPGDEHYYKPPGASDK